jgi:hypothetical protein
MNTTAYDHKSREDHIGRIDLMGLLCMRNLRHYPRCAIIIEVGAANLFPHRRKFLKSVGNEKKGGDMAAEPDVATSFFASSSDPLWHSLFFGVVSGTTCVLAGQQHPLFTILLPSARVWRLQCAHHTVHVSEGTCVCVCVCAAKGSRTHPSSPLTTTPRRGANASPQANRSIQSKHGCRPAGRVLSSATSTVVCCRRCLRSPQPGAQSSSRTAVL